MKAGYKSSKKDSSRNGYRLFCEARVRNYFDKEVAKMDEEMLLSRRELIMLAKDIVHFDMKNVLDWTGQVRTKVSENGEVYLDGAVVDLLDSKDVNGKVIQSFSFSPKGGLEVKCEPRLQALRLLMQVKGMLNEPKNEENPERNATHIVIEQTIIDKRT